MFKPLRHVGVDFFFLPRSLCFVVQAPLLTVASGDNSQFSHDGVNAQRAEKNQAEITSFSFSPPMLTTLDRRGTKQKLVINLTHSDVLPFNLCARHFCMLINRGWKTAERLNLRHLWICLCFRGPLSMCLYYPAGHGSPALPPLIWEISVE